MGYTHYWSQQRAYTAEEWQQISATIKTIIGESGVTIAREYDRPDDAPCFDHDSILFNGVGGDGHETLVFTREIAPTPEYRASDSEDFQFCKTARKPYDDVVVASLIAAAAMGVITWSSDGDDYEHTAGRELYLSATNGKA